MKKKKVAKILKQRWGMTEGSTREITICLKFDVSDWSRPPPLWVASCDDHDRRGKTPHDAIVRLLECIAKEDLTERFI